MPITVDTNRATVVLFLITAGLGALGGLLADLATTRTRESASSGELELLHKKGAYFDLGFVASALLGLGAALVALAFFRPVTDVISDGKTIHQWDPFRLVGIAVLAGFGGPKFLKTAQARLLGLVTAQRAQAGLDVAKTGLQKLEKDAKRTTTTAVKDVAGPHLATATQQTAQTAAQEVRAAHQPQIPDDQLAQIVASVGATNGAAADALAEDAADAVATRVSAQVDTLTSAIDAAAGNGAAAEV